MRACRRRSAATSASEIASVNTIRAENRSVAAGPVRTSSLGSPEDAKGGEHHADGELERVLRHPAQRRVHGDAGDGDHHDRGSSASAASPTLCWFAPKVQTMNATSRPSRSTPLKHSVNP